ncbi:NAD-dependent epimerase/dehydratase family protein [Nocardia sp. NPDC050406]|uniref:NAD-dependent epimerase/dehydratase family protein n=1 Tax=Nocardia sp. NPDC050406 TaxID=3364318 RepID=UPI00378BE350
MSAGGVRAERERVLLTGAAGYIGAHVHRALRAAGHEVVAVDLMSEAVHGPNATPPEGVSLLDIRDADGLEQALRGIDVVCHLAAAVPLPESEAAATGELPPTPREASEPSGDRGGSEARDASADGSGPATDQRSHPDGGAKRGGGLSPTDPQARVVRRPSAATVGGAGASPRGMRGAPVFVAHNDVGTAVLLAAMERVGVRRLVLASSVAVYGEGRYRSVRGGPFFPALRLRRDLDRGLFDHRAPRTGDISTWEPLGEDAPLRPRSAYAASKLAQENYALAWSLNPGVSATALRYHHVYGEAVEPVRSAESGVVARFRADLLAGRAPKLFEDGGQVRDFVHVRDVAAATVAAVERALPGFVPLNIASGRPVTVWEVAAIMSKALGGPNPVVTGQYRLTDIRHLVANPDRARQALHFAPRILPAHGLAAYATGAADRRPS